MLYMVNPCGPDAIAAMRDGRLGYIDTPAQGNTRPSGVTWCADNGCFSDAFDEEKWWRFLLDNVADAASCLFAAAPDVVGDAAATLARSSPWLPRIRDLGYPAALVAQNGLEHLPVPWPEFDTLFVGGAAECRPCGYVRPKDAPKLRRAEKPRCPVCGGPAGEWKLGPHARRLVTEAKERGKWVHMGRLNSETRYRYARHIGCDSADGTYLVFGPSVNLPKALRWGLQGDLFVSPP